MSVNKAIIVGRLGAAPELKYLPSGQAVATFSVATNESYTDKQGNKKEITEWHRIVSWGKQAEVLAKYLAKGSEVYLECKIKTRTWEDETKKTNYTTELEVKNFSFIGGAKAKNIPDPTPPENDNYASDDLPL